MPDYSKGVIYMLEPTIEYEKGDIYYGSTTQPLHNKIFGHKSFYNINNKNFKPYAQTPHILNHWKPTTKETNASTSLPSLNQIEAEAAAKVQHGQIEHARPLDWDSRSRNSRTTRSS